MDLLKFSFNSTTGSILTSRQHHALCDQNLRPPSTAGEIRPGMSPSQIAEVVSDHIIAEVRKQFNNPVHKNDDLIPTSGNH